MSIDLSDNALITNFFFLENKYKKQYRIDTTITADWRSFFDSITDYPFCTYHHTNNHIIQINQLITAYRQYGHLHANINPLDATQVNNEYLYLDTCGIDKSELDLLFPTQGILKQPQATLREIIIALQKLYCQNIGFEFKGFCQPAVEEWIQQHIENNIFDRPLSDTEQIATLELLTWAEQLELFLHIKHASKKRFSLEGAETLIPMLSSLISHAAGINVEEIMIGMSHRGRLNVLMNILHKPLTDILRDFDDEYIPQVEERMGDMHYHKGHANNSLHIDEQRAIKITVCHNPSHLESINPVVQGQVRARQRTSNDTEQARIIPLLLHGDAALTGQGIVYETMQLQHLLGYSTGGTLHIVINNQIGFTTSPQNGRSTYYCTDIAHTFGAPVFHVNAEHPESCIQVAKVALEIRQRFHCDVFIDFLCYRKHGHNEGDEPRFTQPLDYQIIQYKPSIRTIYFKYLLKIKDNILQLQNQENGIKEQLQKAYDQKPGTTYGCNIEKKATLCISVQTNVELTILQTIAAKFNAIPVDFHIHPKLHTIIKARQDAMHQQHGIDWGLAEYLAYGTLLHEGISIRLSGQDSRRGTFSHRHAVWVDQKDNSEYIPLAHLNDQQGHFEIIDSCLSEAAVLGFEYGYSVACEHGLTIWEAQFGDFSNVAQVFIDQYIVSGEQKWGQRSNLVLFLPHGFEGQGPEHSSARLERFLSLASQENMQIVNPTRSAQLFHLLRRQMKQPMRIPLIVMTPKGLLRHQTSLSTLQEFAEGAFESIIDDHIQHDTVERVVLCCGHIYYDLAAYRTRQQHTNIALVRIEQLYPLAGNLLKEIIARYVPFKECLWVQEEPENMGAWPWISCQLPLLLPDRVSLIFVGRERSATPATGFYTRHQQELQQIMQQVFH